MSEDDIDEAFDLICEEAGERLKDTGLRRHQIDQVTTFQTLGNSKRHRQLRSFLQDAFEALGANGAVLFAATLSQKRIDKLGRKRWLRLMQRIKASITLPDLKYLLPPWVRRAIRGSRRFPPHCAIRSRDGWPVPGYKSRRFLRPVEHANPARCDVAGGSWIPSAKLRCRNR